MQRLFKGIYGIVLTPFKEDGSVDYKTLEKQVEHAVNTPTMDGLVVCGSTGEFSRLNFNENIQIMNVVRDVCYGKKQFICGATAGDNYNANKYVEHISNIGADGILIAPPFYFKLSDDEIYEYYRDIMVNNTAKIPVIGYNIPQCTVPVSVNVFRKLLEFDCFKGFKNSWNDMQEITTEIALRDEFRPDISMMTGLDACLYGSLSLGGDGIFSAIAYLMPEISQFIYSNFGKSTKSFECQCDLIKIINVIGNFTFPYGYRVLSDCLGMSLGKGREIVPLAAKNQAVIAKKEMYTLYQNMCYKYLNK